jgi:hypothetical protein
MELASPSAIAVSAGSHVRAEIGLGRWICLYVGIGQGMKVVVRQAIANTIRPLFLVGHLRVHEDLVVVKTKSLAYHDTGSRRA